MLERTGTEGAPETDRITATSGSAGVASAVTRASVGADALDGRPEDPLASSDAIGAPIGVDDPRGQARAGLGEDMLCPYLRTADGDWRAAWAHRDHRCGAVEPPAPLSGDKQRRLCLVAGHLDCVTFQAAQRMTSQAAGRAPGGDRSVAPRWPVPRTAPVVLDRSGRAIIDWRPDRSLAQAGLIALMVVAFAMLAMARLSTPGDPNATPGTGSPTASPGASPAVTAAPDMYRVKAGDTLIAIAARFGTTVAVLQELNGIQDPSKLRTGQVLRLPPPESPSSSSGSPVRSP